MELFDATKSIIENLYFISGPLVLITIIIGIFQLRTSIKINVLAKESLIINSKRDSIKLAVEQDVYLKNKITSTDFELSKLRRAKNETDLSSFYDNEPLIKFTKAELMTFGKEKYRKYIVTSRINEEDVRHKMVEMVYSLNTVAITFNSKVADDETGFSIIGIDFCDCVELYYPVIALIRTDENDILFLEIKCLYHRWKARINKHNISLEIEKLSKESKKIKDTKLNPLGTE